MNLEKKYSKKVAKIAVVSRAIFYTTYRYNQKVRGYMLWTWLNIKICIHGKKSTFQSKKGPPKTSAIGGKLLGVISHVVSENTQSALREEHGWSSFAVVLTMLSCSGRYEVICVMKRTLCWWVTTITIVSTCMTDLIFLSAG